VVRLIDGGFMRGTEHTATSATTASGTRPSAVKFVLGLAAVVLFYIALSGVWTFMEAIGTGAGNSAGGVAVVLSIATLAGIASALVATVLGDSPQRRLFLLGGYVAMAVSVALLFGNPALLRFAVAAVIFKFAWTFILPYLLSALADLSAGGHVMNTTNLMIGAGFAIGPLVGGVLIEAAGGGFVGMLGLSVAGVLLSMLLILMAYPERHLQPEHCPSWSTRWVKTSPARTRRSSPPPLEKGTRSDDRGHRPPQRPDPHSGPRPSPGVRTARPGREDRRRR